MRCNLDWKFHRGDVPQAWLAYFDDSTWRNVTLPHDWSVEEPFDPQNSSGTGYLPAGIGWYRKSFPLDSACAGKRVTLTFEGIYNNAMIYYNGYYLGKRPYGYSEIKFDVSSMSHFGELPNVICVRVNHEHIADSRWFTGSGMIRGVEIDIQNPICLDDYGVFASTLRAQGNTATVRVRASVRNDTKADAPARVRHALQGSAVLSPEVVIPAGATHVFENTLEVEGIELWSPSAPSLYDLDTTVLCGEEESDQRRTTVGLRTFRFDADRGFFLNGENLKLKGVCVHHDAGALGAAVRPQVWKRRLEKLKEMGCNAIRTSHNPAMPELYDLCDRLGFLVIDEAFDEWEGVKNKWARGHNVYPPEHYGYYEDFPAWHEADLSGMVKRDRNHASVILWSIGNEIDYPNDPYNHPLFREMEGNNDRNKPAAERVYNPMKPSAERLPVIARRLKAIVLEHDDTRPVTAALAFPELSTRTGLNEILDVVGYNYKEHLYVEDHRRFPALPLLGSENGGSLDVWRAVVDHDFISATFLWTGIDFLGEARGWPVRGSMAGRLDLAGFEKPMFYFWKSLWNETPVMQIAAARRAEGEDVPEWRRRMGDMFAWNFMEGEDVEVVAYTNCDAVEIRLNGEIVGEWTRGDGDLEPTVVFPVRFAKGRIEAVGRRKDGGEVRSALETCGAAAGIRGRACEGKMRANGEDMAHVVFEVVDGEGRPVWGAGDRIEVEVDGDAKLMGLENGDLADCTAYRETGRRAYHGRLLAYIGAGRTPGTITIRATSTGLRPAEVRIEQG